METKPNYGRESKGRQMQYAYTHFQLTHTAGNLVAEVVKLSVADID